ncbi:DUF3465 domain-containing protein [Psychromonas sp. SP041]|uniref:DUF3465 domain-containing protein n=1 Tax=Psychromonas sp. SP041 TaxID=1365007 RepID=UPI00040AF275|nr:DUF3465 domain-containing protein [Psychromonas sp. SP041]
MKKILAFIVIGIVIACYQWSFNNSNVSASVKGLKVVTDNNVTASSTNESAETAYQNRRSDVQVNGAGTVIKLLNDDNKGSRHQKFILRLGSGQTILIAHNIDLAPRINSISQGDQVEFYGEYEWNDRGGVVHWTHSDPNGYHVGGWLKHQGRTYQ